MLAGSRIVLPCGALTATLAATKKATLVTFLNLPNVATRQRLQVHHPEAASEIDNLQRVLADASINADLLELCAAYFDVALAGQEWSPPAPLSDLEQACIDVCEQFMISVSDIREEQIALLRRHLTTDDVYNLMSAIYLIEMSKRLDLTLERVIS